MDRYVMRHPEIGGPVLVPASALDHNRSLGWLRVSEPIAEEHAHRVDPAAYADAADLDAPEPAGAPLEEAEAADTTIAVDEPAKPSSTRER